MPRYFLEVSYKGSLFSGFQAQANANSIQAEVEKAFSILHRAGVQMTGSSRTDAGVHALQNYFHFDFAGELNPRLVYKMNALLPPDIVVKQVIPVRDDAHCRFDAVSREYKYFIYNEKSPFQRDRAYYFPYPVDLETLNTAAAGLMDYDDFTSFSKRNTQVKTFRCRILESGWVSEGGSLVYRVKADRFLRGMVRALVATMLKVGRGNLSVEDFRRIIALRDCTQASFAVPAHGLFLVRVEFPGGYFDGVGKN